MPDERYWVYYDDDNSPTWIRNPFNGPTGANYSNLTANHGSNYNPEDGWELIKVEFGSMGNIGLGLDVQPGPNTNSNKRPKLPYMMLYNKYSGTLRFFGSLLEPDNTYETVRIELRIPKTPPPNQNPNNIYQDDLKATNLLSIQGESMQPLDQETDKTATSVFVRYTNNPKVFFWFDLPMAYDPCVCNNKVQLDVSFTFVQTAKIAINQDTLQGIHTATKQTQSGNQNYAKMVFGRILAAGISGATAIATGGAVINVKAFTDLIDIVHDHPSRTTAEQNNLNQLKGYLTCSEKMFNVVKGSYKDVSDTSLVKAYAAGQKILDGSTTFLSSLAKGCNDKDNAATSITGAIQTSGTFTLENEIEDTRIKLALPGSNWSDKQMQSNDYAESNGKVVPAYPTYNERLGTFALLETPEVAVYDSIAYNPLDNTLLYRPRFLRLGLLEDIKYTFNPKMNVNISKTSIYCRYVITNSFVLDFYPPYYTSFRNINMIENTSQLYRFSSPFVPIDQFKSMPVVALFNDLWNLQLQDLNIEKRFLFSSKFYLNQMILG